MSNDTNDIIEIDHLSHAYGTRQALADVSLRAEEGHIHGFLGPNGSGKTTLFRLLSTSIPVQSGQVRIMGLDLRRERQAIRRHIGVVFQAPSLDRQLTAEENLRHHGHLYGLRGAGLEERIGQMLERFGLADRRRERVGSFSGGLRRRVELAKGLLTRPRILLLDEPSTGLDPSARIDLWQALRQAANDGVTIMVTTHLMDEGDRCDRLAIMDAGRIVAIGSPVQLKERIGGDVITMTSHDVPALRRRIMDEFGVEGEEVEGVLRIERPRGHEFVPALVERLPGLVDSVSIGKPTLEDVFIHATGHRFRD
jgi:ABC-2 type transport system ATP-binding protein